MGEERSRKLAFGDDLNTGWRTSGEAALAATSAWLCRADVMSADVTRVDVTRVHTTKGEEVIAWKWKKSNRKYSRT